jgi:hypothetical protein
MFYILIVASRWVINTPALYSGGPGSSVGSDTDDPDWIFVVLLSSSRQIPA